MKKEKGNLLREKKERIVGVLVDALATV